MFIDPMQMRPRRLRHDARLREMVAETRLVPQDFIQPLFVTSEPDIQRPITSMPGLFQWSLNRVGDKARRIQDAGVSSLMLFGLPEIKDELGRDTYCSHGIVQRALYEIKKAAPELYIITDVCFCQYMNHGHCGIMSKTMGRIDLDNEATLEILQKQARSHVEAGADMLAPSGMADGAVGAIRTALDAAHFTHIPIMAHTVKYASSLYGPFREATDGAPQYGDRHSYQMDIRNGAEALKEAALDILEGVDCLMVKPAGYYLDIIYRLHEAHPSMPLAGYQVSGEYAMLKAAIANGWLSERSVFESLIAIKRAGANLIVTYFAEEIVPKLSLFDVNIHPSNQQAIEVCGL